MIRAALYFGVRSARNRIVKTARNPRYLLGLVLIAAYIFWVFRRTRQQGSVTSGGLGGMTALLTMALAIMSLLMWFIRSSDRSLALTKAQAQTFLPAPLTSQELLLFKVMMRTPLLIWNAVIFGFVLRTGFSPHLAVRLAAAFIVVFAMYMQLIAAALVRMPRVANSPRSTHPVALALVRVWLVAATAVAIMQAAKLAADNEMFGLQQMGAYFAPAYHLPWSLALWPFHALVAPAYASTLPIIAVSLLTALFVVAVEVELVFRTDPPWDRVGIAELRDRPALWTRSRKRHESGSGSVYLNALSSLLKRPAAAIAWKNLVSSSRTQPVTTQVTIVVGIPILLAVTLIPQFHGMTSFALGMTGAWAALLIFAGPQFVRNDLRMDLPRLRLLRTYPLTSLEICIAEVGASVSLLTFLQLVLLILSTLALLPNTVIPFGAGRRIAFALALVFLFLGMNAVNISAQNIFALMFPKWMTLGMKRPLSRSANPGQFYISLLISIGLFVVSMIVPLLGAAAVEFSLRPLGISIAVVAAAFVAGAIAVGEAALGVRMMAGMLDRLDPSSIVEA